MNDTVDAVEVVEADATTSVLDAAATLYKEGKEDEAFKLILDSLGEEAAISARDALSVSKDEVKCEVEST